MATPNKKPTDPNREALGRLIREKRDAAGLSQTELALEMGVRTGGKFYQTTIGRIENGERSVSLTEAAVLSRLLSVPVSTLANYAAPLTVEDILRDAKDLIGQAQIHIKQAVEYIDNTGMSLKEIIGTDDAPDTIPDRLDTLRGARQGLGPITETLEEFTLGIAKDRGVKVRFPSHEELLEEFGDDPNVTIIPGPPVTPPWDDADD